MQNISSVDWSQGLCLASSQVSTLTTGEKTLNILISTWNLDLSPNPTSNTFQQPLTNALPLLCESFPTTHSCLSGAHSFHSQQHHCTRLLSVIATQPCGSSQLQLWALPGWTRRQQLPELLGGGGSEQLLFVKRGQAECRHCKVPNLQQSPSFAGNWLQKGFLQNCKMSSLFLWALLFPVFLSPFFQRKEQYKYRISKSAGRKAAAECHHILPFPPLQCCPDNAAAVRQTATSFGLPLPRTSQLQKCQLWGCWDKSCAAAEASQSQQSHQGTAWTGPTPSFACSPVPFRAGSGRLLLSHSYSTPGASHSLLNKLLCAPHTFPHREQRVFGHLQALLLEELEDQLEQVLQ